MSPVSWYQTPAFDLWLMRESLDRIETILQKRLCVRCPPSLLSSGRPGRTHRHLRHDLKSSNSGDLGLKLVEAEFGPSLDFASMARAAAGPRSRRMEESERLAQRNDLQDDCRDVRYDNLKQLKGRLPPGLASRARFGSGCYPTSKAGVAERPGAPLRPGRLGFRFHHRAGAW